MDSPCHCTTLRLAARRLAAAYDEALAPVGLNVAQFALLRQVQRLGPVSLTQLGELAELDRSTVGRNVRVLERARLVKRGRGRDQREATVELAKAGHAVLKAGSPLWAACQRQIESRLGQQRMQQLRELLREI